LAHVVKFIQRSCWRSKCVRLWRCVVGWRVTESAFEAPGRRSKMMGMPSKLRELFV